MMPGPSSSISPRVGNNLASCVPPEPLPQVGPCPFPDVRDFVTPRSTLVNLSDLLPAPGPWDRFFSSGTFSFRRLETWNAPRSFEETLQEISSFFLFTLQMFDVDYQGSPKYWVTTPRPISEVFLDAIKRPENGGFNLSATTVDDVNFGLKERLPENITDHLWPIHCTNNPAKFYEAFSASYIGWFSGEDLFKQAVAYRILVYSSEFSDLCKQLGYTESEVISNLRNPGIPTSVELGLLSTLTEKKIVMFEFDKAGNMTKDLYFDAKPEITMDKPTVYIGCIENETGLEYFPLVRKTGNINPPEATLNGLKLQADSRNKAGIGNNQLDGINCEVEFELVEDLDDLNNQLEF